jgi:hypothetical protein
VAKKLHMTWVAGSRRWRKLYKGKWYSISCKLLGTEETKEGSWRAANEWWEREKGKADALPVELTEKDRQANAVKVWALVDEWKTLDEPSREKLVDALLGAGRYAHGRYQRA